MAYARKVNDVTRFMFHLQLVHLMILMGVETRVQTFRPRNEMKLW